MTTATATVTELPLRGRPTRTGISNEVFGMGLFLIAEVMVFVSLISAYLVLRAGLAEWPPADQPRLPIGITLVNTFVLFASGAAAWIGVSKLKRGQRGLGLLGLGALLGVVFLAIQGYEWAELISFGLTTRSSLYGALFYTLIGTHAVHALGGLVVMAWVTFRVLRGHRGGLDATRMYWSFVVLVWPFLYVFVYLY